MFACRQKFVIFRVLLGLFAVSLLSCGTEPSTRLIVVFISDLEINRIQLDVKNLYPARETSDTIDARGGLLEFPGSFVLEADEDSKSSEFTVTFTATGPSQSTMLVQRVRTNFVQNETRRLLISLSRSCLGVVCSDTQVCNPQGECENYWREGKNLERVDPGKEFDGL